MTDSVRKYGPTPIKAAYRLYVSKGYGGEFNPGLLQALGITSKAASVITFISILVTVVSLLAVLVPLLRWKSPLVVTLLIALLLYLSQPLVAWICTIAYKRFVPNGRAL